MYCADWVKLVMITVEFLSAHLSIRASRDHPATTTSVVQQHVLRWKSAKGHKRQQEAFRESRGWFLHLLCVFFFCCCYKNIVINVVLNNVSNDKNKKNIYININKPSISQAFL